jgi:hypothetical protein
MHLLQSLQEEFVVAAHPVLQYTISVPMLVCRLAFSSRVLSGLVNVSDVCVHK